MTEGRRNALIGLFVLCGLVCLGVLIVKFGESRWLFSTGYIVTAKFEHAEDINIREGTEVRLAGVPVGRVVNIDLYDRLNPSEGLKAELEIRREFVILSGSVASVIIPLMGQPVMNIIPPPSPGTTQPLPREGGAELRGTVKRPLESVIDEKFMDSLQVTVQQIGSLAESLKPAAEAVTKILEPRPIQQIESPEAAAANLTPNLSTVVERLHNVLRHFDLVLGDPEVQSNVKLTVANLKAASEEAKLAVAAFHQFSTEARQTAADARAVIAKLDQTADITHQHIDQLGRRLLADADKVARLLDHFIAVGDQISRGEGTAGLLLRDPQLYEELLLTVRRLREAGIDLQVLIKKWQTKGLLTP